MKRLRRFIKYYKANTAFMQFMKWSEYVRKTWNLTVSVTRKGM